MRKKAVFPLYKKGLEDLKATIVYKCKFFLPKKKYGEDIILQKRSWFLLTIHKKYAQFPNKQNSTDSTIKTPSYIINCYPIEKVVLVENNTDSKKFVGIFKPLLVTQEEFDIIKNNDINDIIDFSFEAKFMFLMKPTEENSPKKKFDQKEDFSVIKKASINYDEKANKIIGFIRMYMTKRKFKLLLENKQKENVLFNRKTLLFEDNTYCITLYINRNSLNNPEEKDFLLLKATQIRGHASEPIFKRVELDMESKMVKNFIRKATNDFSKALATQPSELFYIKVQAKNVLKSAKIIKEKNGKLSLIYSIARSSEHNKNKYTDDQIEKIKKLQLFFRKKQKVLTVDMYFNKKKYVLDIYMLLKRQQIFIQAIDNQEEASIPVQN